MSLNFKKVLTLCLVVLTVVGFISCGEVSTTSDHSDSSLAESSKETSRNIVSDETDLSEMSDDVSEKDVSEEENILYVSYEDKIYVYSQTKCHKHTKDFHNTSLFYLFYENIPFGEYHFRYMFSGVDVSYLDMIEYYSMPPYISIAAYALLTLNPYMESGTNYDGLYFEAPFVADFITFARMLEPGAEDDPLFLKDSYVVPETKTVTIRDPDDISHMTYYFKIHYTLIDYVGKEAFEDFKNQFGGTADFNILHFIEYFNISKSQFEKITSKEKTEETENSFLYPYNINYLYGTKEEQDVYLLRRNIDEETMKIILIDFEELLVRRAGDYKEHYKIDVDFYTPHLDQIN